MNQAVRKHFSEFSTHYPSLPNDMKRNDWLDLVDEISKAIGVGNAARFTLRAMAAATRPRDWTSDSSEPICYMAQSKLSERTGVSVSRIRAHQVELEKAGLIQRKIGANGFRSGHSGCGIYFSSGIALTPKLLELRQQQREDAEQAALLRGQRSQCKGFLRSALESLAAAGAPLEAIQPFIKAFNEWPRADALHRMSLEVLVDHVEEVRALCISAEELLSQYSEASGQPPENERSHIQDTTQDSIIVNCNEPVRSMSEGKPSHSKSSDVRPIGLTGYEDECEAASVAHKSEFIEKLSPTRLYNLASEEMQLWLDVSLRGRSVEKMSLRNLIEAADRRVPELGINASAWIDAVTAMGPELAALCVMVIDANRSAPVPIRNPGGYLRAMISRFSMGQLNIVGSLIGLTERRRSEG